MEVSRGVLSKFLLTIYILLIAHLLAIPLDASAQCQMIWTDRENKLRSLANGSAESEIIDTFVQTPPVRARATRASCLA